MSLNRLTDNNDELNSQQLILNSQVQLIQIAGPISIQRIFFLEKGMHSFNDVNMLLCSSPKAKHCPNITMTNRFPVDVNDIATLTVKEKHRNVKRSRKNVKNNLSFKMKLIAKFRCSPFKYMGSSAIYLFVAQFTMCKYVQTEYKPYHHIYNKYL